MTEAKPDVDRAEDGRVLRGTRNRDRITDALFELIESGELRSIKVGRARRIPAAAIDEFIDKQSEQDFA